MGCSITSFEEVLLLLSTIGSGRNDINITDLLVLVRCVQNPAQPHKYYKENARIPNAPRMHRTVARLVELGFVETTWNPDKPTYKELRPTEAGKALVNKIEEILAK